MQLVYNINIYWYHIFILLIYRCIKIKIFQNTALLQVEFMIKFI